MLTEAWKEKNKRYGLIAHVSLRTERISNC